MKFNIYIPNSIKITNGIKLNSIIIVTERPYLLPVVGNITIIAKVNYRYLFTIITYLL